MSKRKYLKPLLESALLNIIIYMFFYRLRSNPSDFFHLSPQPQIFLIIGFALFYGNLIGGVNTLITLFFYGFIFYDNFGSFKSFFLSHEFYKYPLIYLWLSAIIGTVVDNYSNTIRDLTHEKDLLVNNYNRLKHEYRLSNKALKELKNQIIDADESIISLYDIAKKLRTLDEEEILTELVGILKKYLKVSCVRIYYFQQKNKFLRLKLGLGLEKKNFKNSIDLNKNKELEELIRDRSVKRLLAINKNEKPLLTGPVIKNNRVIGVVMIDEMEFESISNYAYTFFNIILDWVNISLDQVKLLEDTREESFDFSKVLDFSVFKEKLKHQERRKKEYGLAFYLLGFQSKNDTNEAAKALNRVTREIDYVSLKDDTIYLLLVATEADEFIRNKIIDRTNVELTPINVEEEL